jgi:HK97 family phage prohead protease
MKHTTERRTISCEFRVSGDNQPVITGYASVFGKPSEDMGYIEYIDAHAFDSVLAAKPDCRCLWNHNPDVVLGRTTSGTLKLSIDETGLQYECTLPDTQAARDLAVSMKRGDVTQSSFAFVCGEDKWEKTPEGNWTRRILQVSSLLDCSPCTYPAYTDSTSGVRSLPSSMPAELRSRLSRRSDGDAMPNANGCECDCPECMADNCEGCSDPDCTDPNCLANQGRAAHLSEAEVRAITARIAIESAA